MALQDYMNNPEEIEYLHPILRDKLMMLVVECQKNGIELKFSDTFRTIARQNELYAQGRTAGGHIVTNAKGDSMGSQHQWGIAADFFLNMDIDGDGEKKDDAFNNINGTFQKVGTIAKNLGLSWGGDWKFTDMPHLYLPYWGDTTKQLKEKYGSYEKFRKGTFNMKAPENGEYAVGVSWDEVAWVKAVQGCIGAKVDGIVGTETLGKTPTVSRWANNRHLVVAHMQRKLNHLGFGCGKEDGIAGELFEKATIRFQNEFLRNPDGIFDSGNISWRKLLKAISKEDL